jgi:hypothetical protein
LFVIASMLAMGLALTIPTIVVAISNVRLMTLALVANFVVVPTLAYGAAQVISTSDQGLRTGLILLGVAAGAPFLPRIVTIISRTMSPTLSAIRPRAVCTSCCTAKKVDPLRLSDIPIYDPNKAASVEFVSHLNWLLGHVEPNPADADTLARFSKIGIAGGAPFFSDALSEEIRAAIAAGVRAGDAEIDRKVAAIGTTVNAPPLPVPAVGAFWSVTMYRLPEKRFVANPLNPYSIGDRTPGITTDGDGDLILRLYVPGRSVLDGSWQPAAVENVGRVTAPADDRVLEGAAT